MKIRVKQGERLVTTGEGSFELEANSHLELTQVTFAEQDLSQSFEVIFLGEGASCNLYFLDLAKNSSHLETIVKVFHKVPNCKSTQLHKGLYSDESVGSLKALLKSLLMHWVRTLRNYTEVCCSHQKLVQNLSRT